MPSKKPTSLSDVVKLYASEGANDAKWILVEHQLAQAKMSVQIARETLREIANLPENSGEVKVANDCFAIVSGLHVDVLDHYSTFLSYLSGTEVSEKMGRKEL